MILVTGGTGFLGSTLLRQLTESGHAVLATKRSASVIPDFLIDHPLIHWVDADICDYDSLKDIFKGIETVFHCAAQISFDPREAQQMYSTNVNGTANVVNLCLEYQARLIYISSIAALGHGKEKEPINEKDYWEKDKHSSGYSISKHDAEMEVWRGIAEGLTAVILNPSVIIGHQAGKSGSGQIFETIHEGLSFYPTGSIGLVDVEDVATIAIEMMSNTRANNERYIVNSTNISHQHLIEITSILMNKKAPKWKAGKTFLRLAAGISELASRITQKSPRMTKSTAYSACQQLAYSNKKLDELIQYQYKPLELTLNEIAKTYLNP